MNRLLIVIFIACSASFAGAQTQELFSAKLKKEVVPSVIIEAIIEDFPDAEVLGYAAVPITVLEDAVYVHTNPDAMDMDYDTYVITLSENGGHFQATYDKSGRLLSKVEVMKDVALPAGIRTSIGRHFPMWAVVGDKEVMISIKDGQQKTHYKVTLEKDKEKHHVVFDGDGNIIRGANKAKPHHLIIFPEHKMNM